MVLCAQTSVLRWSFLPVSVSDHGAAYLYVYISVSRERVYPHCEGDGGSDWWGVVHFFLWNLCYKNRYE